MNRRIDADGYPFPEPGCPFCLDNELVDQKAILVQTGLAYAIWARNPPVEDCILLIPKHHLVDLYDLPTMWHAEKVALLKRLEATDIITDHRLYTPSCNLNEVTGRTIEHFHDWMIPRTGEHPESVAYHKGAATLIGHARQASALHML